MAGRKFAAMARRSMPMMANRHFGKVADVCKHVALVEIVALEQPGLYGETHAGSAGYPLVVDPERRYGAVRFLEVAATSPLLATSRYRRHVADIMSMTAGGAIYPGSPLLAMRELGRSARYLLCDLDVDSVADIARWAETLGLASRVQALTADGMATIVARFRDDAARAEGLVHIDPFDPHAREDDGPSALEVAGQLADQGVKVVYWYGYDVPADRAWTLRRLRVAANTVTWWCSDMLITDAHGATRDGGDLGAATTPGTGFGVVTANLGESTHERCAQLGDALARSYAGAALPDGTDGALDHRIFR